MRRIIRIYILIFLGGAICFGNYSCVHTSEKKKDENKTIIAIKMDSSLVNSEVNPDSYKIRFDTVKVLQPFNRHGIALIENKNYQWNFANRKGYLILEWQDHEFETFAESDNGIECFPNGRSGKFMKWGYLNKTGSIYIPFIYDFAFPFSDGLAAVVKNSKLGFINSKGELKIDYLFDYTSDVCGFSEGLCQVYFKGKGCYIDTTGKIVIPPKYKECDPFYKEGFVFVKDSLGYVYMIDKTGKVVIDFSRKDYYVNRMGTQFSNGRLLVKDDVTEKCGFINHQGKIVIDCQYDDAISFCNGLAAVYYKNQGFWGFINTKGEVVLPFKYPSMVDRDFINITDTYLKNKDKKHDLVKTIDSIYW